MRLDTFYGKLYILAFIMIIYGTYCLISRDKRDSKFKVFLEALLIPVGIIIILVGLNS